MGWVTLSLLLMLPVLPTGLAAQDSPVAEPTPLDQAPIVLDGETLFFISGISVYSAEERARRIRGAVIDFARSTELEPSDLSVFEMEDRTQLLAGKAVIVNLLDSDGAAEGLSRSTLAEIYQKRIQDAVLAYRADREPGRLLKAGGIALAYLGLLAFFFWAVTKSFRWFESKAEKRLERNLRDIEKKSQRLVHAGRVWILLASLLRSLRLLTLAILIYLAATHVLELFPWTRSLSDTLLSWFLEPLRHFWRGLGEAAPGLVFILVLFLVIRYMLSLMRALFRGVESGSIRLANFDADWAMPTYKIARVVIIAFGVVIAYPYIPGSDSLAFKGVSVFVGVLLSIGSSSVISNTFAGLSMIYRRAFKVGDRVCIGDVLGVVEQIRLQTTQIVTAKNESVILPNSNIMNANVLNYSQLARDRGLILHTTVGIGYDTPWRQVEAMLLEAAGRTPELLKDPAPFVLQQQLGDFAADYQINAYCASTDQILELYSDLHGNIKDVFNENGVQIMSPAYVGDPAEPKVVKPENSFLSPATSKEPRS